MFHAPASQPTGASRSRKVTKTFQCEQESVFSILSEKMLFLISPEATQQGGRLLKGIASR